MKKTVSIMTISLLTATTLATASPSEQMDLSTLNKSDSHMLFGETHNSVKTLGQNEMTNTEGAYSRIFIPRLPICGGVRIPESWRTHWWSSLFISIKHPRRFY